MLNTFKNKAEEHLRENNITQYEYKSYIEGANFGANYVLDIIKKYVIESHFNLEYIVKQLKGNQ